MTDWRDNTLGDGLPIEPADPQPSELELWAAAILDACLIALFIITAGLFAGVVYARYF